MGEENEGLSETLSHIEPFKTRIKRAAKRLSEEKGNYWHFAVLGLNADFEQLEIANVGIIRKVYDPPGIVELSVVLREPSFAGAIGRYSENVEYEISIRKDVGKSEYFPVTLAQLIFRCLRVKTLIEMLVPAFASHSWSVMAALPDNCCDAFLLEDVPRAWRFEKPMTVGKEDFDWVFSKLTVFSKLYFEFTKFRIATDALDTHHHISNLRMMAAQLWSGIEAVFGLNQELRFRIAAYVATILEPRGIKRKEIFKQVLHLYDIRSKAVHGGRIEERDLKSHVVEVRKVLSRLLCNIIEAGKIPEQEIIEDQLFS
jgi:hypothetical protein